MREELIGNKPRYKEVIDLSDDKKCGTKMEQVVISDEESKVYQITDINETTDFVLFRNRKIITIGLEYCLKKIMIF